MSELFEVNAAKCVKCGACVRDCAFRALRMEADGLPKMAFPNRWAVSYPRGVQRDGYANIVYRR